MELWHAYVDESGDRGWKVRPPNTSMGQRAGSSRIFSLTAIIVPDGAQSQVLQTLDILRATLGREPQDVLHWQNIKQHGQRRYVAQTIAALEQITLVNVVICKWHLEPGHSLDDPQRLYHWGLRLMIERLSWLAENTGGLMTMTFGEVRGLDRNQLDMYLAKLQTARSSIAWGHLKTPPRIDTPANRRMLQVADSASGACFAAFNPDDFGNTEPAYLWALKDRIWRRADRPLWQDGLKVVPWPHEGALAEHPWFEDFCA